MGLIGGGFIAPVIAPAQRIDPAKVLLIGNSSNPLSQQAAEYYRDARGLGGHQLNIALGGVTLQRGSSYADVVLPIANYIEANAAVNSHGGTGLTNLASRSTPYTGLTHYAVAPNALSYDIALAGSLSNMRAPNLHSHKLRPFGRLGVPSYSGTPAETLPFIQRIIDDAIWAENNSRRAQAIAIGVHSRVNRIAPPWQWMAFGLAEERGLETDFYVNAYGVANQSWFGKAPKWNYADVIAGTAVLDVDAHIGGTLMNLDWTAQRIPPPGCLPIRKN